MHFVQLSTGAFDLAQIVCGCDTVAQLLAADLKGLGPRAEGLSKHPSFAYVAGDFVDMGQRVMAAHSTPHFHNQPGVPQVRVGAREFMCVGSLPPFDHPHIFIDMGDSNDAICPYCSTHYAYDSTLHGGCEPPECVFDPGRDAEAGAKPALAHG